MASEYICRKIGKDKLLEYSVSRLRYYYISIYLRNYYISIIISQGNSKVTLGNSWDQTDSSPWLRKTEKSFKCTSVSNCEETSDLNFISQTPRELLEVLFLQAGGFPLLGSGSFFFTPFTDTLNCERDHSSKSFLKNYFLLVAC